MIEDASPLVSVIIPIFNVEKYVEQCVRSVMSQTYENLEILCIDDQGRDGSINIISNLAKIDRRIRIVVHHENLGLGQARNSGIMEAAGDFIYFLDADDWIMPRAIEDLVEKAILNNADVAIGSALAFPDDLNKGFEKTVNILNKWLKLESIPTDVSVPEFYKILEKIPCVAWGKLYRLEFLKANNLTFISKKVCHEDDGFHIKCMVCKPKLAFSELVGYQYRIRSASLMNYDGGGHPDSDNHAKIAVEDALEYIGRSKIDEKYIDVIKDFYWKNFAYKKGLIFFYWGRYSKLLKFWRITLIKQTCKDNVIKLKVLGVPLCQWNVKWHV